MSGFRSVTTLCAVLLAGCSGDPTGPHDIPPGAPRLAVGETTVCAAHTSGSVYCWGEAQQFTQFGEFTGSLFVPAPRLVQLQNVASFAQGPSGHMCAVLSGDIASCWGRNSHGQVGSEPIGPHALRRPVSGGFHWRQISIGRLSSCGVTLDGRAHCWGSNLAGELGASSVALGSVIASPTRVEGDIAFESVAAGWRHSCGIAVGGVAYCWGENTRGQLGIGIADSTFHRNPTAVSGGHRFVQLAASGRHTCGITTTGQALCWGDNSTGQLGDGSLIARHVPTSVAGSHTFRTIATGSGFGGGSGVPLPAATQGGIAHTCALTLDGAAYCWGWSAAGQVGNPAAANFQLTPIAVAGNQRFDLIGVGGAFSCGMRGDAAWCWGANPLGQLGNGGIASSPVPVAVGVPFTS